MLKDHDETELIEVDDAAARTAEPPSEPMTKELSASSEPADVAAADDDAPVGGSGTLQPVLITAELPATSAGRAPSRSDPSVARTARPPDGGIARGIAALHAVRDSIQDAADVLTDPLAMAVHRLSERQRAHVRAVLEVLDRIEADKSG